MTDLPITPPVPQDVIDSINSDVEDVQRGVARIEAWDKSPLVAAVLHVLVLLGTALYLKLPAKDVAAIGSVFTAGSAYFVTAIGYVKANARK